MPPGAAALAKRSDVIIGGDVEHRASAYLSQVQSPASFQPGTSTQSGAEGATASRMPPPQAQHASRPLTPSTAFSLR
eukprot:CAMPEP_0176203634 /NCGR_PEP_ID=MMETSP0121_2-20121125/10679_1 /TAXON_ID=160619 /ORGANISM="Kryptoperidinium foliaceum, Strain CCMP 1326" /LENGTH=76 /DNA_ID=CAMNT_0017542541 /DNA_START=534 /DNA_END=764 /DNA_ORIENTATION=+